uniref:Candidate secreted effector n=1 Tax=Meloidogyne incognita TaxID=6306 RepID=A0A914LQ92_MELIC
MLPAFIFMSWVGILLLASVAVFVPCAKKKKNTKLKSSQRSKMQYTSKMDSKMGGASRKIDSPHSVMTSAMTAAPRSPGKSKKQKDLKSTGTVRHKLTKLEPSLGSRSDTDESDVRSRETGQRTRERDAFEETGTLELQERLRREVEGTKTTKPLGPPRTQITPTKSQTVTTSVMGKTATSTTTMGKTATSTTTMGEAAMSTTTMGEAAMSTTTMGEAAMSKTTRSASLQGSTVLEERKPVQVNRAAGVRSKTISQIGTGQEQSQQDENEVRNNKGGGKSKDKTGEVTEEEGTTTTVFGKMKKTIQKLKKP